MDIPVTLREKLKDSRIKLEGLETELNSLILKFREVAGIDEDGFDSENKSWENFANTHTGLAAWLRAGTGGTSVDGENHSDLAHREIKIELIQDRIKTLQHWIRIREG